MVSLSRSKYFSVFVKPTNRSLDLWDVMVGPVVKANITTTVAAVAVPASSLVPPPFLGSYSYPTGQQVPEVVANSSWSFPKDFQLGVAGAAFQIEGAAKDEGRGPSVWDKLVRFSSNGCVCYVDGEIDLLMIHRSACPVTRLSMTRAILRTTIIIYTSKVSDKV